MDDFEDTYGTRKRFGFIEAAIVANHPKRILDVGCGVGRVSLELARRFPNIEVVGVDVDQASIEHARLSAPPDNARFLHMADLGPDEKFDLVIASEVLEHVERPDEFLVALRKYLSEGGCVVLTVPNGYGPFEMLSLVQGVLQISGVYGLLRAMKRLVNFRPIVAPAALVTHANSTHINFFSLRVLRRLIAKAGLEVHAFRARTFLCGFLVDQCFRGRRVIAWNANIADRLPQALSSDWMFLLGATSSPVEDVFAYSPGLYGRFHRYVNRRCTR